MSAVPGLERVEDRSGSFKTIFDRFHNLDTRQLTFPQTLPAMSLQGTLVELATSVASLLSARSSPNLRGTAIDAGLLSLPLSDCLSPDMLDHVPTRAHNTVLVFSPPTKLELDLHTRRVVGAPDDATMFTWCHGAMRRGSRWRKDLDVETMVQDSFALRLITSGGFTFLSPTGVEASACRVAVRVISPDTCGGWAGSATPHDFRVCFGPPVEIPRVHAARVVKAGRNVGTTVPGIMAAGASQYAWILPGELPHFPFGGFMYFLRGNKEPIAFPITVAH
eukprot:CAMPEP_0175914078 /NCGR_PEP_ID=MMETSP0108-20121206/9605_1 /TAXON_ID=195067 ORGANISM="Goniomonas pacifica, Strain CCMP1869" /NCGR_SAMPLE_ID=MMETSP0108 /ASSEMBLY_ACC=CAM_ASM_000204 /LENGTH=277 /DNA_ID=CAMNT_0017236507 /DNA_START=148 /DNA_END=981 /DNA_ORIENTATION=-